MPLRRGESEFSPIPRQERPPSAVQRNSYGLRRQADRDARRRLPAQLAPWTRATGATDLALYLVWLDRRGALPLAAGRPDIDRYRNWTSELVDADGKPSRLCPRFAPATVAKRLSAVRSFCGSLVDHGAIDASPEVGVPANALFSASVGEIFCRPWPSWADTTRWPSSMGPSARIRSAQLWRPKP